MDESTAYHMRSDQSMLAIVNVNYPKVTFSRSHGKPVEGLNWPFVLYIVWMNLAHPYSVLVMNKELTYMESVL